MNTEGYLKDRQDIADLMTGWMHRDLGEWDQLRSLFAPNARIEITWFSGLATDFVDRSAKMGTSDIQTKHVVASPRVAFSADGRRATSETNAIIIAEHRPLTIGCMAHARFLDRLVRYEDTWRIADRKCSYDMASFAFPIGPVPLDTDLIAKHPVQYGALAYILEKGGFAVEGVYPTRGSIAERDIKDAAATWLEEEQA